MSSLRNVPSERIGEDVVRSISWLASLLLVSATAAFAADAPSIVAIDCETPTDELPFKPDVYVGQKIRFNHTHDHDGETVVRIGVCEAGVSKTKLIDYPFTEYVMMISRHLVITNDDGAEPEFKAGDTFVILKAWIGVLGHS